MCVAGHWRLRCAECDGLQKGLLSSLPSVWSPSNSDGNQIGNFATLCEDGAAVTLTVSIAILDVVRCEVTDIDGLYTRVACFSLTDRCLLAMAPSRDAAKIGDRAFRQPRLPGYSDIFHRRPVDFAQGELGNGGTDKQGRHSRTGDGRPMPRKESFSTRCKQRFQWAWICSRHPDKSRSLAAERGNLP